MKIVVVKKYELDEELNQLIISYDPMFVTYDPEYNKIKARRILGCFAATELPFVGIYDDEMKPIKGFYSEAKQVNYNELKTYFDSLNKVE